MADPETGVQHACCMLAGAVLDNKTAQIIDGKLIADTIRKELALEVAALKSKHGRVPGLAVVLVGSRGDSATYVRMKSKACVEVGIESFSANLPEDISEEELLRVHASLPSCAHRYCRFLQSDGEVMAVGEE